ncbi:MAG: S1C family serine protease [Eubacteriaceae bacterium]
MNEDLKKPKKISPLLIGIIGALIGGLMVGAIFIGVNFLTNKSTIVQGAQQQIVVDESSAGSVVEAIAEVVPPSVVGIKTTVTTMTVYGPQEGTGVGSGFIVTSDGYIATNQHVVGEDPTKLSISLADGNIYEGELVWADASLDMAIVKIDAQNLPVISLGNSETVKVGELAVAVGNPLGLNFERTVTAGIVSALNRSIPLENNGLAEDLIQTDASINQGNSGGPLVNKYGEVIGINTYKLTSGESMGFSIPINILKPILNKIVTTGKFTPVVMGITGYDRAIADYYVEDTPEDFTKGIYLASVQPGGGAANAGLAPGDIILEIDGMPVNTMLKMKEILYGKEQGEKVTVTYQKDGKVETASVTVS